MILTPVNPSVLRVRLQEGITQFAFKKLDGTLRLATGTTDLSKIPVENHPTGEKPSSPKVVTFWDVELKEWRAVSASQEIFMEEQPLPLQ